MISNIPFIERILRLILGIFLLSWAIAGGPFWSYVGLFLIMSASWGYCPLRSLLKKS